MLISLMFSSTVVIAHDRINGTVMLATTSLKVEEAADSMVSHGLIKGVDTSGNLALNANITRAELVTILVRAFGQDENAKKLNGVTAFPDTAHHPWASGYIALAKNIIEQRTNGRESVGLPDGTFNPDGNVTAAEAIAFLMKFTGAPKDETLTWPHNYLQGALQAGFIDQEDLDALEGNLSAPATRGLVFYLADSAFSKVTLAEGKTVYDQFHADKSENRPPQQITKLGSITTQVGGLLKLDLYEYFLDPDGDPLTFTSSQNSIDALLTGTGKDLEFTASKPGSYTIIVSVTDGKINSSLNFELTVGVTNAQAPKAEDIHVFGFYNIDDVVNVLNVSKGKVKIYDAVTGGNLIGEESKVKVGFGGTDFISVNIDGGFAPNLQRIYVEYFDENGVSTGRVEKLLEPLPKPPSKADLMIKTSQEIVVKNAPADIMIAVYDSIDADFPIASTVNFKETVTDVTVTLNKSYSGKTIYVCFVDGNNESERIAVQVP